MCVLEHTNKTVVQILRESKVPLEADLGCAHVERFTATDVSLCQQDFRDLRKIPKGQSQEVDPSKDIVERLSLKGIGHQESWWGQFNERMTVRLHAVLHHYMVGPTGQTHQQTYWHAQSCSSSYVQAREIRQHNTCTHFGHFRKTPV